jgi:hypothetical protein
VETDVEKAWRWNDFGGFSGILGGIYGGRVYAGGCFGEHIRGARVLRQDPDVVAGAGGVLGRRRWDGSR